MAIIDSTDLSVRLQKISCAYKDKAVVISNDLAYGLPCTDKVNDSIIITYFIEMLQCYDVTGVTETELDELNCITYDNLNNVLDWLSKKLDICFAPYGAEYVEFDTTGIVTYPEVQGEDPTDPPVLEDNNPIVYEAVTVPPKRP